MASSILQNASAKIDRFNDGGLHYNLVASEIYKARSQTKKPLDKSYLPYIIAGLASFDMSRMMGASKYSFDNGNFAARLYAKLQMVRPLLEPLLSFNLMSIDLQEHSNEIKQAYTALSARGPGALHQDQAKSFYVGASKVLHFLNPELFIMVDRYAARSFWTAWKLPFRNTTQPGYSAELYVECMKRAKTDIAEYGVDNFRALEPNTPITRIYDKLTFVTGSALLNKSSH
jgi:hypothetical protein